MFELLLNGWVLCDDAHNVHTLGTRELDTDFEAARDWRLTLLRSAVNPGYRLLGKREVLDIGTK